MDKLMKISQQLLAIGILYVMPLPSTAQEVVPYANSEVKVGWVRGTDFSKYTSYAWGTPNQKAPDPNHPLDDIDAALKAEGLQKVGLDANPDLVAAFSVGNKQVYVLQHIAKNPIVKQGTLVVELADPQLKKVVWWGVGEGTLTDDRDKDLPMIQRTISKMFKKYPPLQNIDPTPGGSSIGGLVLKESLIWGEAAQLDTTGYSLEPAPFQSMMLVNFHGFLRSSN
jgi:Domain of unknown function (DUF4136)